MKKLSSSGIVRPFFLILIIILVSLPMGFYGMYLYLAPSLPDMSSLKKAPLLKPLQVYTADNKLIAEYGGKLSIPVKYEDIPPTFIHAFLAAEDSSFFEHNGISFKGLGRALTESVTGSDVQTGGSTITMQVAKNYYLSPERTLRRKLTEVFLARKIEQNLTKQEILSSYVNKIFLGKNAYGIAAAARIYYNKNINELTTAQMAMIAGLPKAPSKYNPVVNPERALERRNWILGRMLQLGYINQAQYQKAVAEPINLNMIDRSVSNVFPYVGEMVRSELVEHFGEQAIDSGYKVYTTIDSNRQRYAEEAVQEGLEAYDRRHGWRGPEAHDKPLSQFMAYANTYPAEVVKVNNNSFEALMQDGSTVTVNWSGMSWVRPYRNANSVGGGPSNASQIVKVKDIIRLRPNENKSVWSLVQVPKVQGQLIALNPNDGAIEAVVGGYNFYQSKFNRAVQGWRQPGSTIKPFVYALAIERGMTPYTMVNDSPITIGKWSPKNSDGRYLGMIPLRRALYLSRNTVSVRLLQNVGIERARQLFMDFGLEEEQIPRNYTIALGTPQVLPVQMATGYATFANGGYRIQPHFIKRIEDASGKVIYETKPEYACIPCINDPNAYNEQQPDETQKQEDGDVKEITNQTLDDATAASETQITATDTDKETKTNSDYRQAQRILKSSSAYDMANILRDVIQHGTGRAALKIGRDDLGGKTGTTNDAKDAWFAGFNGKLVAIAWVGFDQPRTLGRREYGGVAALPIWTNFMANSLKDTPSAWVRLDKEAKEPISRDKLQVQQGDDKKEYRASPPLARPLYRPAPPAPDRSAQNDFSDLPDSASGEEQIMVPTRKQPPAMGSTPQNPPPQRDRIENLINEIQ
ncbi:MULTISPECIES: penicillin-binding protein PBP1a [unclassified Acinetobacter]|uniref:penicillin-binding protein PBP1a n=1 Tax=unclassified Acinetobacter TaxID=196816 RepID=UPI002447F9CD|nr:MULTISPECIES: penicillin-binding protein PBP1a [unclassified Acinetobacter]MDH0029862.1 penicillin-binding protein PBP1a [Acinetobacter sp. GD04021]MDH0885374.1 penicillin-binding protein PBP1a [Acinetobacter sp. GD03873]MDH1081492.1 penicillin-binding protein PBP1a [Acinetobacter sp. GD03983]MDH2188727.1 penicillin-binding protein PBP1a [Acinetobacter sp. GD03645]MDH2203450.1 penicillin-binding protein PBP1a [Acinetobacter sp. GD03647]